VKPKVFVTRNIEGVEPLKEEAQVVVNLEERSVTADELLAGISGATALLSMGGDPITARILEAGKELKIVANNAVGYNNIDVPGATQRKIAVTNTPEVLTETTADLSFSLMLAVARRLAEADRFVREGKWIGWRPGLLLGSDVHGKTLGVIGLGRIGSAVARRGLGFNMKILYHDIRKIDPAIVRNCRAKFASLEKLLQESDFVTLHVNLTPESTHLIGRDAFRLMKKSAFLINASRGPVVDEAALIEALQSGEIAGAGLDVFEKEPQVPAELKGMANVVGVPHIGSATRETRLKMAGVAVKNILAVLRGKRPPNLLNPEIYKKEKK
jgi:glyoxylate reductase